MSSKRPRIAIPEPTSFDPAYNARGWPQYAHAVEMSGGEPVLISLQDPPATAARLMAGCSGVLLPGSPADLDAQKFGQPRHEKSADPDPAREAVDDLLLQDAFNLHKPILGICYGMQSMNVWKNGTLKQHVEGTGIDHAPGREVHEAHTLEITPASHLAKILGDGACLEVNSSHHQAVDQPGDGLAVVAWSAADKIVEAVEEQSDRFVVGVQWHPERTFDVHLTSRALLKAFIDAAASWHVPEA